MDVTLRQNFEVSCVIFGPWVSYLIAEALSQSGIVSILLCGVFMAHYTRPNLSEGTQVVVGKAYTAFSHAAENLVFIFLGMGAFSFKLPFQSIGLGLAIMTILGILLGRVVNIVVCSLIVNAFRTHNKVTRGVQISLWFAGPRGAISFALAVSSLHYFRHGDVILTLTLVFSVGSILVVGAGLSFIVRYFCGTEGQDQNTGAAKEGCEGGFKNWLAWLDEAYLYPFFVSPVDNESLSRSMSPP